MEIIKDFIPEGRDNRPGYYLSPRYITIHNTANNAPGSDALMHARYLKGAEAASRPASWHFTVDEHRVVQHLPLNESGWHAGDGNGPGNRMSIGVEICENADGDITGAEANAARLVAWLLPQFDLGISRIVQHNKWSGKNCPHIIRGRVGGWEQFIKAVQAAGEVDEMMKPMEAPDWAWNEVTNMISKALADGILADPSWLDKAKARSLSAQDVTLLKVTIDNRRR